MHAPSTYEIVGVVVVVNFCCRRIYRFIVCCVLVVCCSALTFGAVLCCAVCLFVHFWLSMSTSSSECNSFVGYWERMVSLDGGPEGVGTSQQQNTLLRSSTHPAVEVVVVVGHTPQRPTTNQPSDRQTNTKQQNPKEQTDFIECL